MDNTKKLFGLFPPVTTTEWMEKITADLKGADFNKKLVWKTSEGLEIMPFYRQEDLDSKEFPYVREKKDGSNSWRIRQDIIVKEYGKANTETLDLLMKGIDSIGFVIEDAESVNTPNFSKLLNSIAPGAIEINFFTNGKAIETVKCFQEWLAISGQNSSEVYGAVEADPLGRLLMNGTLCIPPENGFDYLAELVRTAHSLPHFRVIDIKASFLADAGSDISLELALAISLGTEYIRQLTGRGLQAKDAASAIRFTFGIGPLYFPEIAKLRAARLLWATVMNGFAPENSDAGRMEIHSKTARWNKTIYDPYVNMLRTQTEAMSAVIGGADSVTVEPFDVSLRNPDSFSARIARNQQLILKEESYFDRVSDPAAGSYYVEKMTDLVAEKAWKTFVAIEDEGGFLEALKAGSISKMIGEAAKLRKSNVSARKIALLGTNLYPDPDERIPEGVDLGRVFPEHTRGVDLLCDPVIPLRASAVFDKLRIDVAKSGRKPAVFLLTMGDPVMRKARAKFSADFFGCAGYKVISNRGFGSTADATKAALDSRAEIVVVCSSDDEYAVIAPELFRSLVGKVIFVVAGNPACTDDLKAAGIEHFISIRSDAGAVLSNFNRLLGIS